MLAVYQAALAARRAAVPEVQTVKAAMIAGLVVRLVREVPVIRQSMKYQLTAGAIALS